MAKEEKKKAQVIKPIGDRVLVRPESASDERSPSGIIIPDTARKEKPERGEVLAVGDGKRTEKGDLIPLRVKKGDTIIFSKYGYDEVKVGDEDLYILTEANILAVVE